ncbi:MAG: shikimate kinase [Planctomycetota bacterium]
MTDERRAVVLIGMPGAGKTTVGRCLAHRLGVPFLDLDDAVIRGQRAPLRDIVTRGGVAALTAAETAAARALDTQPRVIATGGSVVLSAPAMDHLARIGRVVFIDVELDELARRIGPDLDARGVARTLGQTLADVYAERLPLYHRYAEITVRSDDLGPNAGADDITAGIAERLRSSPR